MIKKHSDENQDQPQQPQEETPVLKRSRQKRAPRKRTRRRRGEGTVTLRKDGRYQANISLGIDEKTGKRKRLTRYGKTEEEAYEKLHQALEEHRKGTLIQGNRLTVGAFLDDWLETVHRPTLKLSTYMGYRHNLDKHIIPEIGNIQLQKLHQSHVQAFYTRKLDEGLTSAKVRLFHAILHQALDHAVKWEYVVRNVSDLVSLPRVVTREPQFLSEEQALHLLETLRGQKLEAVVSLALATGMRKGELLSLRWSDINLEDGSIQIRHTVSRISGYGLYESEPKSKSSRRHIVLPDQIVEVLQQHRAEQEKVKQHAGDRWQHLDLVFTNRVGSYLDPVNFNDYFNAAVKEAGLPPMHFHDLRHSAATLLLAMGIHPKIVQELLGHSNIAITMNLYSHVLPSMQHNAMKEMDKFLKGKTRKQLSRGQRKARQKTRHTESNDEEPIRLKQIEDLINDAEYIRKSALRLAGLYLRDAEEEIIEQELNNLDNEILKDEELSTTYETLIEVLIREVAKIGDELIRESQSPGRRVTD